MAVTDEAGGFALTVLGLGPANEAYHFRRMSSLTAFAESHEQELRDAGFTLQATSERRSGRDRRQDLRGESPERRRR